MIGRRKASDMQNLSISHSSNNTANNTTINNNFNSDENNIYQRNLRLRSPLIRKYPPFRTTIAAILFLTLG